jgi:hypothetical protein
MSTLEIGQKVKVNSPGHGKDGCIGPVTYFSRFMGTWGVEIDGHNYGFFASELEASK